MQGADGPHASARTDSEVFANCSGVENWTNERFDNGMASGTRTFNAPAALHRINGCRLLMIDDDGRWIRQVEVTAF